MIPRHPPEEPPHRAAIIGASWRARRSQRASTFDRTAERNDSRSDYCRGNKTKMVWPSMSCCSATSGSVCICLMISTTR